MSFVQFIVIAGAIGVVWLFWIACEIAGQKTCRRVVGGLCIALSMSMPFVVLQQADDVYLDYVRALQLIDKTLQDDQTQEVHAAIGRLRRRLRETKYMQRSPFDAFALEMSQIQSRQAPPNRRHAPRERVDRRKTNGSGRQMGQDWSGLIDGPERLDFDSCFIGFARGSLTPVGL